MKREMRNPIAKEASKEIRKAQFISFSLVKLRNCQSRQKELASKTE
jgi:hypothetical protein